MIKIKNTKENNLKNISLEIPKNKITSIIGVSGSGKSTLIYNVIAKEAKRREKIASGNATCLDYALRPDFKAIENLPYCVTLKQRGLSQSKDSTIATITKLHELLREEISKYGEIVGDGGNIIKEPSIETIKKYIKTYYPKEKFNYYAILCKDKYTTGEKEILLLKENDIKDIVFISSYDNKRKEKKVANLKKLNSQYAYTILVPFKNLDDIDSLNNLAKESFLFENSSVSFSFNTDYPDIETGKMYQKKSPQLLSFNSISNLSGKCEKCNGDGKVEDIDFRSLIIKDKALDDIFLDLEFNSKNGCYKYIMLCNDIIKDTLKKNKINPKQTYYDLTSKEQKIIKDIVLSKISKHKSKPSIGKFIKSIDCPKCNGTRLNYKANAVKLFGKNISELLVLSIDELYDFFYKKTLHHRKILDILLSLKKATLGYLSLDRTTDTLSGGELQRLKFSLELQSEYKGLLYILDEPSSGLHPYNNYQMIQLIKDLKSKKNTIIMSEHDNDYIKNSDFIVELGPKSGEEGGEIVFYGDNRIDEESHFLRDKKFVDSDKSLILEKVNFNNILNEDFFIPLNSLVTICGVSGSGKSTLIHNVLVPTLKQYIDDKMYDQSIVRNIKGLENISSLVEFTQSQIGLNSRSIVATYLNLFDFIRDFFSDLENAKELNLTKSHFSFNSEVGQCETCKGLGEIDEFVCSSCLGNRYKPEVLEVTIDGLNIIEVLNTPIKELNKLFNDEKLSFTFGIMKSLGLSHITLGRTTPTLSGGEAQRLKLVKTLVESFTKIKKGNFLFILDEPTTGLSNKDKVMIYKLFDKILSYKNSIIIIEHDLEMIKNSDFIIELGVGSGKKGGKNIFSGSYEELFENKISLTAKALRKEYEEFEELDLKDIEFKEKKFNINKQVECHEFYMSEKHFEIEKEFMENYRVITDENNYKYFKTEEELYEFVDNLEGEDKKIFFNPFTSDLYNYKQVPLSLRKQRLKTLKELGFNIDIKKDLETDEWNYKVEVKDLQQAYSFGRGWISVESNKTSYELFTRVISFKNKIVGIPKITQGTFNLYLNSCSYCGGSAKKDIYDINLIIKDKDKSILDKGFLKFDLNLNLKSTITRFSKEELFDFSKPFYELDEDDKNIFLFGFKAYKFLKPNGRINALGDYFEWKGLYYYIYENLTKIKNADEIKNSKHSQVCPFCKSGFKNEVIFYEFHSKKIFNYLE